MSSKFSTPSRSSLLVSLAAHALVVGLLIARLHPTRPDDAAGRPDIEILLANTPADDGHPTPGEAAPPEAPLPPPAVLAPNFPAPPLPTPKRPPPAQPAATKPPARPAAPRVADTPPAPQAPGAASDPASAPGPLTDPAWRAALRTWLSANQTYPEKARRLGVEGRAVVRITIAHDGRVLQVDLQHGTGSETLDDAVLAMLHAAHVPPLPADMPQPQVSISFAVTYSLVR